MSQRVNVPLRGFRAYLTGDKGLSAASAETYVKHVRRVLIATNSFATIQVTAEELVAYDGTLSVAMRDGFRAAWGHYVEFLRAKGHFGAAHAPSKNTSRPSSKDDSSGT